MALRLLEIAVAADRESQISDLIRESHSVSSWQLEASDSGAVFHVVLPAEETEPLMDDIETACVGYSDLRMVLVAVEASVPRADATAELVTPKQQGKGAGSGWRVSREELYEDAAHGASLSPAFHILIALSAIVAAVGLMKDDLAVVIGAMVIAPLYGPNAALAMGASLGDMRLIGGSLKALMMGLSLAFGLSALVGLFLNVDPSVPSISTRTVVGYTDVVLALAAGAAGAVAFTSGRVRSLTGVMVAVALLPPIAAFGLLLGSGHTALAWRALLLTAANVICINLAGVAAFVLQGVKPRSWWEAERAKRASRRAAAIWLSLLVVLVVILAFVS